jgi:phospholipase C
MILGIRKSRLMHSCCTGLSALALGQFALAPAFAQSVPGFVGSWPAPADNNTKTPIKHVIVIIGENRSFDHVFATYAPPPGQSIDNLLSKGIISLDANKNAIQGPNFQLAQQLQAQDTGDVFLLSPPAQQFANNQMPSPLAGGPKTCGQFSQCLPNVTLAQQTETGLSPSYYQFLTTGATGLSSATPDTRITGVTNTAGTSLAASPFQLTNSNNFTYTDYSASPVHRFYQMWQQLNCNVSAGTPANPPGCNSKLFSWVEVTVGAGANGVAEPSVFSTEWAPSPTITTGEGSTALGFYNVQQGDVPYFTSLAQKYGMSDNFHQSVNGGTGANHIMFGHADALWFSDANGNPAVPSNGTEVFTACNDSANPSPCPNPDAGFINSIENPNPQPGTNNFYTQDGYGSSFNAGFPPPFTTSPVFGGGSYSNCSDPQQPGVKPVLDLLQSLQVNPRCDYGHYYLLNNYNPGWFGNGNNAYLDQNPSNTPFTIPPSSVRGIGDALNDKGISWKYYGDQWNNYVNDPYQLNWANAGPTADEYCNICNPFQYDTSIMSNPAQVAAHIQDSVNLYGGNGVVGDIANGTLPAVSVVKPSGYVDGHPSSSKLQLFEGFVKLIVDQVQGSAYAHDTAIFITFDEGGGYYDSGYVQPVDFFGDGTRIPLIAVGPNLKPGFISHDYSDHVSIIKFIERNWSVAPITTRSRDNFPNPITGPQSAYVPVNSPALSDLMDMFQFANTHDFNGDGKSDIAWRDTSSGNTMLWYMNGTRLLSSSMLGTVPTTWTIVGQRDFDGDGKADLLWRDTSGNVAIWFMNGNQNAIGNVPTTWSVVGTGDFNGDGKGDILWQDTSGNVAIWEMNGATILNQSTSFVAAVPGWSIKGTGDFNGDGKADILWQDTSGNVAIWEMNGTAVLNAASSFVANVPSQWSIKGTGDFNGDAVSDIVWQDSSGNVAIWEMNGTHILNAGSSFVGNVPSPWSIQLTGDFNGDGMSDVLWQDTSGDVAIWEMNGTAVLNANSSFVGTVPSPWSIQYLAAE